MIRIIKADGEEKQFLAEVEKRAGQVMLTLKRPSALYSQT